MEGSEQVAKFGLARAYDTIKIIFDGKNGFEACTNPRTGEHSEIRIRMSLMPKHKVDDALLEDVAGKSGKQRASVYAKWGIGINGQGFHLLREGREILSAKTLGIYQKHEKYNYMHGEVEFDSGLDDLFRVRTNKSRLTVTPLLSSLLQEHVGSTLARIRDDHKKDSLRTAGYRGRAESREIGQAGQAPPPTATNYRAGEGEILRIPKARDGEANRSRSREIRRQINGVAAPPGSG